MDESQAAIGTCHANQVKGHQSIPSLASMGWMPQFEAEQGLVGEVIGETHIDLFDQTTANLGATANFPQMVNEVVPAGERSGAVPECAVM